MPGFQATEAQFHFVWGQCQDANRTSHLAGYGCPTGKRSGSGCFYAVRLLRRHEREGLSGVDDSIDVKSKTVLCESRSGFWLRQSD